MKQSKAYNSRRYHDFFEGYTERVVTHNGKEQIERVYTGEYYCSVLTSGQRVRRKGLYVISYTAALLLYGFVAMRVTAPNLTRVMGICHGLISLGLLWELVAVVYFTLSKGQMIARVYRAASLRLITTSRLLAALYGLMALVYLVEATIGLGNWLECLQMTLCSTAGGALMLLVSHMEVSTVYVCMSSGITPDADGELIEY